MTKRLEKAIQSRIRQKWVKGHQTQKTSNWKTEIEINNFTDKKVEIARTLAHTREVDPYIVE